MFVFLGSSKANGIFCEPSNTSWLFKVSFQKFWNLWIKLVCFFNDIATYAMFNLFTALATFLL